MVVLRKYSLLNVTNQFDNQICEVMMVKNYTAVQNDVNLNVSSVGFNRKESNDEKDNKTENVHSIFCCGAKNLGQYGGFARWGLTPPWATKHKL